jgi:hypothetical protein
MNEWAKFCKALSKNGSWAAAIVLVVKGRQISPLHLGLSSSKL